MDSLVSASTNVDMCSEAELPRLEGGAMPSVEGALAEMRAEIARLAGKMSWPGPSTMKKARAAEQLDVSPKTLDAMIRRQEILTVIVGKREMIPASEILRISTPKARTERAARNTKARSAKGYSEEILQALRKKKI